MRVEAAHGLSTRHELWSLTEMVHTWPLAFMVGDGRRTFSGCVRNKVAVALKLQLHSPTMVVMDSQCLATMLLAMRW